MKYKTIVVDPKIAESWLKENTKNRRLSLAKIKEYADQMKKGNWSLNGATICFSIDGRLLDGQHRLNAVIQSGVAVAMSVVRGVEDENAFLTYDVGLKRNVSQEASLRGIKSANNIAAIAKKLLTYERTEDKARFSLRNTTKLSLAQRDILQYLEQNLEEIESMFEQIRRSLPYRNCGSGSSLVAALMICKRQNSNVTQSFIEGLITGCSLPLNSPIGLLRDKFMDGSKKRNLNHETEVMALTIKAWNKYAAGKQMKTLRWVQDKNNREYFPTPGGKCTCL